MTEAEGDGCRPPSSAVVALRNELAGVEPVETPAE